MEDFWTSKDSLNEVIAMVSGGIISYCIAYFYEWRTIERRKNNFFNKYSFLQSNENEFDWQHWNIDTGKIADFPIKSFMSLKYDLNSRFSFRYKDEKTNEVGDGFIFWEDLIHGKMFFQNNEKHWFGYRNVYNKEIEHLGKKYQAIFVNADDQEPPTKYVMMRPLIVWVCKINCVKPRHAPAHGPEHA